MLVRTISPVLVAICTFKTFNTRMWANAQRDGRLSILSVGAALLRCRSMTADKTIEAVYYVMINVCVLT